MSEQKIFYKMNVLMNFAEMDAFTALKNAGSRTEYFKLLDEFTGEIPRLAQQMEELSQNPGLPQYLEFVDQLQNMLFGVGAPALVWDLEKAVMHARADELPECARASRDIAVKLSRLGEHLRAARMDEPSAFAAAIPSKGSLPDSQTTKPKAEIKLESFEKLQLLIENFELEGALSMLDTFVGYTYSEEIDALLLTGYERLNNFDYDGALKAVQHVIKTTKHLEAIDLKSGKKKILAVDDMPDVLNTVKSVLSTKYTVYGVTNHKAALKFLMSNAADLILLDIEMPHMDGFSLSGIIRKIKNYEKTPILFLTGSISVENVRRTFASGANDFIRKPIDAAVLIERVEKYL